MPQQRIVRFDNELRIQAYQFIGLAQRFPNHFHEFYVLGLIDSGKRELSCLGSDYLITPNDFILFNPQDKHTCKQIDHYVLDYRSLHITVEQMLELNLNLTGNPTLPHFKQTVIKQYDEAATFRQLHQMIIDGEKGLAKEEMFYFMLERLIQQYADHTDLLIEIELTPTTRICNYLKQHYQEKIMLETLSKLVRLNKYTLLRTFTKEQGITPYQYLQTIRISEAKKRLEQGNTPIDVAIQTGFTDQSHFTRFFKQFIGVTPKQFQDIFNDDTIN